MTHHWPIRVYYEDTDLAGIVYYANYLRFIERARSEMLRAIDIDQTAMKARGLIFAVRKVTADYITPARYDDMLDVRTHVMDQKGASIIVLQQVYRDTVRLFEARVTIVVVGTSGRPTRIPPDIRAKLNRILTPHPAHTQVNT